ncbi:DUF1648 domain-containing protein [Pseudalkalibacillus hwajinpoensis]|uniref:DUF1648 domain-containing protein n=1 Tax=Guptibacillus hwajinpoensis TaxID=208199 RepID=UPI001CD80114|nr:DUF1648 domain-containing protein [Pseudalkalibacillus hwajinpoensis]MCA0993723.1 DUF1648 domain-containing protein [Pseudalkalibacillus hwajinpoensis]
METRPRIEVDKTFIQKGFDLATLIFLLLSIVYLSLEWAGIPNRVPIHFNATGEADNWGSKMAIILFPLLGMLIWGVFTVLERYPHRYNYVVKITEGNAALQYRSAVILMRFLKNTIALLFAYLTVECVQIAKGIGEGLTWWVMPLFLTMIFSAIILYIVHSIRWR